MSKKAQGIVKSFNNSKGFGFIDFEGQDYFVHFKSIVMDGYKQLSEGDNVLFTPGKTERGLMATEVEVV